MAARGRHRAELIEAIAVGYGGCKSKDGSRAMQRLLSALRDTSEIHRG